MVRKGKGIEREPMHVPSPRVHVVAFIGELTTGAVNFVIDGLAGCAHAAPDVVAQAHERLRQLVTQTEDKSDR